MDLNLHRHLSHTKSLSPFVHQSHAPKSEAQERRAASAVTDGYVEQPSTDAAGGDAEEMFRSKFADLAGDKAAFHDFMKTVYGDDYNAGSAEQIRQRALAGDFSWLPKVQFVSRDTLAGGNGAFSDDTNTIYLAEDLKQNPDLMGQTFAEEAFHAIDTMVKTGDTHGDEGELGRRLLIGEKLGAADIAAIRAENDKGTITVDGKKIDVEFWGLGDAWDGVKKAAGAVKDAAGAVKKGVSKAYEGFNWALEQPGKAFGYVTEKAWAGISKIGEEAWEGVKHAGRQIAKGARFLGRKAWDGIKTAAGKTWDGIKFLSQKSGLNFIAGKTWDGIKFLGDKIGDGASFLGRNIADGVKFIAGKTWDGIKFLGNETWDGLKFIGKKTGMDDLGGYIGKAAGFFYEHGLKPLGRVLGDLWDWYRDLGKDRSEA